MKTIANILLGIILTISSVSLFANEAQTFTTRLTPGGTASWPAPGVAPAADNWTNANFWMSGLTPPTSGSALNRDVVNIGRIDTQPHHYVLRVGNIGNDQGNNFTINVFPNSTLEVRGNIDVQNRFQINVHEGATSIIRGDLEFHNHGVLVINGEAVVTGSIISQQSSGSLSGTGVLYVGGSVGLANLANTTVTLVRNGEGTDLNLTAPVLSASVLSGPRVQLNWTHTPQNITGFTFVGYQVFRDWAGQVIQQAPFDNILTAPGFNNLSFIDDFSTTTLTLANAPVYYVRAVYQNISNPAQFRFSPISNKVDEFANIVTLTAPVLTGVELAGTGVRVRLNWTFNPPTISDHTFAGFELFRNGVLFQSPGTGVREFIDADLSPGAIPIYTIRAVYTNNLSTNQATPSVMSGGVVYTPFSAPVDFTATPLPIELLSFSATAGEDAVSLAWSTAVEINNNYFTIERSRDGSNWEIITYVQGAGNANRVINYEWNDENPIEGISYYRLKQTDFDGQYEYFAPVAVEFRPNVAKTEILHVNSFGQQLDIVLSNPAGAAHLLVSDLQGRLIYRGMVDGLEHVQQVSLNLPQSFPGNIIVIRLAGQQNSDEKKIRVN